MTPDVPFCADIAADPGDPTVSLIYADWLDDQGRHREARFLRASCILGLVPVLVRPGVLRWWCDRQERWIGPQCAYRRWSVKPWSGWRERARRAYEAWRRA
jgi:uncharacterized protein (TIGR02996 family)